MDKRQSILVDQRDKARTEARKVVGMDDVRIELGKDLFDPALARGGHGVIAVPPQALDRSAPLAVERPVAVGVGQAMDGNPFADLRSVTCAAQAYNGNVTIRVHQTLGQYFETAFCAADG